MHTRILTARLIRPILALGEGEGEKPAEGAPAETTTPPAAEQAGKTFTQAELDKVLGDRLGRERKKWEKEQEEARAEAERQATLSATEKAAEAQRKAEERAQQAEARALAAERRAELTGRVVDPVAALKLLDEGKHVKDGALDVDAFLTDYPFLAPSKDGKPHTPVTPANPGPASPGTVQARAQEALKRGDMTTYIALTEGSKEG